METKFTKGPWSIWGDWAIKDTTKANNLVATFEQMSCYDETFSNARLIAAAPEMFQALRLARKCVGSQLVDLNHDGNTMVSIKEIIDAVMDKATGES